MKHNQNTFCRTVWNGLHILPDGYIRLCSLGTNTVKELDMQRARDQDGNVMHILTHDLKDMINSDKHKEVRRLNVDSPSTWSPHCECCENREIVTENNQSNNKINMKIHLMTLASPNVSRRKYLMNIISDTGVNNINYADKITEDGSVDWLPSSLDIRFGNLCNQKCIMCGPHFSNLWYDEYVDYYNTTSFGQGKEIQIKKDLSTGKWIDPPELDWFENPAWWEKLNQLAPSLRHVYITGGEPMVTPAHDKMLDVLIENKFSQNITLEYDTNLSAINDKIIDRWHKFKRILVRISMDGTEDKYELIRYGGVWDKFVKNIEKLKQYGKHNPRIKIESITSCVQTLTIFDIMKSEEFCKQIGVPFHIRFLEGPRHLSINHLPKSAKLELIEYYKKYTDTSQKAQLIVAHLIRHVDDFVDPKEMAEFVRFMDYLDKSRGTNWKQTLPEVFQLITKHS